MFYAADVVAENNELRASPMARFVLQHPKAPGELWDVVCFLDTLTSAVLAMNKHVLTGIAAM